MTFNDWYAKNEEQIRAIARLQTNPVKLMELAWDERGKTLDGQPPIEHMEWVFQHIRNNMLQGGSFRKLIYDHMGYGPEAYQRLYEAGGMDIVNALNGD